MAPLYPFIPTWIIIPRYLVELALMNAEFLNWRASMVAAAAVALSRYIRVTGTTLRKTINRTSGVHISQKLIKAFYLKKSFNVIKTNNLKSAFKKPSGFGITIDHCYTLTRTHLI